MSDPVKLDVPWKLHFIGFCEEDSPFIWWKVSKAFIFARFGCVIFHHVLGHITQELVEGHSAEGQASQPGQRKSQCGNTLGSPSKGIGDQTPSAQRVHRGTVVFGVLDMSASLNPMFKTLSATSEPEFRSLIPPIPGKTRAQLPHEEVEEAVDLCR